MITLSRKNRRAEDCNEYGAATDFRAALAAIVADATSRTRPAIEKAMAAADRYAPRGTEEHAEAAFMALPSLLTES